MTNDMIAKIRDKVEAGDILASQELLRQNPDLISHQGVGAWLGTASYCGNLGMAEMLIDLGCDLNQGYKLGKKVITPVMTAVTADHPQMVGLLLSNGATPPPHKELLTAIVGRKRNSLELIKVLESFGLDIHHVSINETTGEPTNVLSKAIGYEKEDVIEYLRSRGCVLPGEKPLQLKDQSDSKPVEIDAKIVAWFSEMFGPVNKRSLIEIVPSLPPITVHAIEPNSKSDCVTLFTTGLSNERMNVPDEGADFANAELFTQLPSDWKWNEIENPEFGWPIHWLRSVGKYPFQTNSWLGGPASIISNDVIKQPMGNTKFDSMLLLAHEEIEFDSKQQIKLFQMYPLFPEEREFELESGVPALLERLHAAGISLVLDANRQNVCAIE